MEWLEIFSPDLFLEDMIYRGEIEQGELDRNDPYGMMVSKLCHNSVAWMYKRVLDDYPDLLDQLHLVTGSFCGIGNLRLEHSWVEHRGDKITVIDLTLSQFQVTKDRLFIADKTDKFNEYESVCFSDYDGMRDLIINL